MVTSQIKGLLSTKHIREKGLFYISEKRVPSERSWTSMLTLLFRNAHGRVIFETKFGYILFEEPSDVSNE